MKAKWADKEYRETMRTKPRKPRAKKETVEEPMWVQKKTAAEKARERASKSVTTRVGDAASLEDSMRWYLKLIGQRRLLTPAEVNYLAKRVQKLLRWKAVRASLAAEMRQEPSDEQMAEQLGLKGAEEYRTGLKWLTKSRELLVVANLRLVVSIAKKYKNMGVPMAELVQEGTFGLITAAERYDWKRGFTISTHATWWIRQAIQRALANYSRTVRLPVHMHDLVLRMGRARRDLTQELGREPSDSEVAERLGVPEEKVRELDRAKVVGTPASLDADVAATRKKSGAGTRKLGDLVKSRKNLQDEVEESMARAHIHKVLDQHLTAREANVLKQRFGLVDGERRSLQEIGDQFEVSRERIRQIERGAIEKLRNPFVAAQLKAYVDDGQLEIIPDNVGDS
jgi:RNA polymerase primary sigma factor